MRVGWSRDFDLEGSLDIITYNMKPAIIHAHYVAYVTELNISCLTKLSNSCLRESWRVTSRPTQCACGPRMILHSCSKHPIHLLLYSSLPQLCLPSFSSYSRSCIVLSFNSALSPYLQSSVVFSHCLQPVLCRLHVSKVINVFPSD